MAKRYVFDKESFNFRKVGQSAWSVFWRVVRWVSGAIVLAVFYYVIFSLLFNTDVEKQLSRENSAYRQEYSTLQQKQRLLADVVRHLRSKDDEIYRQIFHSEAPEVDPAGILVAETDSDDDNYASLVLSNRSRLDSVEARTARIESAFQTAFARLSKKDTIPPMCLPVRKLSYVMTGAGIGMKYNPYYKVESRHEGLDIIAPQGEPVYATADGVVYFILRSAKGLGNVVTVDHGNGYMTRYAHLGQVKVSKGQRVKRGEQIAEVGMSGKSFAPHLHYEVRFNGLPLDPVNYFFAALGPEQYAGIAYMAEHTAQSLD